jgi:hypothetical protein
MHLGVLSQKTEGCWGYFFQWGGILWGDEEVGSDGH